MISLMVQCTVLIILISFSYTSAAGFFVCHAPCMAMYLPRDMNDMDDCLCPSSEPRKEPTERALLDINLEIPELPKLFQFKCPENSLAKIRGPKSFADCICVDGFTRMPTSETCVRPITCDGKYRPKKGVLTASTMADCTCNSPYIKDEATGQCYLDHCPRAGNYIIKENLTAVHSLADCGCIAPYVKDDQSGDCSIKYKCPLNSKPPEARAATSFDDCTCNYGYIKTEANCQIEQPSYKCPGNSRSTVKTPRGFDDCLCDKGFQRNATKQACQKFNDEHGAPYECPEFSIPLSLTPISIQQCMCLPGFIPNVKSNACEFDRHAYFCPEHSFNPVHGRIEVSFADCLCAKGFDKDESRQKCVAKLGAYRCPESSTIKQWPTRNFSDCTCLEGIDTSDEYGDGTCLPVLTSIKTCPKNSAINNWPATSEMDCTCAWGYHWELDSSSGEQVCVPDGPETFICPNGTALESYSKGSPKTIDDCICDKGRKLCPRTNLCMYTTEMVTGKPAGRVTVNANEFDFKIVHDDIMVTQGDIAIGTTFGLTENGKHIYHLHGYYNNERDHRWRHGKMCYVIEPELNREVDIAIAMRHIQDNTGFVFRPCGESCFQVRGCEDFVEFRLSTAGPYSYIGRIGGRQPIGISPESSVGSIIHLILHSVGLHHSITRSDRAEHLNITWECIPENMRGNLPIEDAHDPNVPYDFYSIMHHRHDAFVDESLPWCLTLIPRVTNLLNRLEISEKMGQREQMSLTDIHYVWGLYPELKTEERKQQAVEGNDDLHASHIHTKEEALPQVEGGSGIIGGILCIIAILCFGVFLVVEYNKQKLRGTDHDECIEDPLLHDRENQFD